MSIFSSAKAKLAAQKLAEERLYELAHEEITANNIRPGLWAKALAETDGNEVSAKARYIKLRVDAMKAEADLQEYADETLQKNQAEADKREKEKMEAEARKAAVNEATGERPDFTPFFVGIVLMIIFLVAFAIETH